MLGRGISAPEDWAEDLTPEAIRESVNEQLKDGDLAYYRFPVFDVDENIHHITGTGRLEWFVDPTGVVDAFIHRPKRDAVLSFTVLPTGEVTEMEANHSHIIEDTALPRHVWMGNRVIQVVLGGNLRKLHPALATEMDGALLSAREAAREAADRLRREVTSLIPYSWDGNEEWQIQRVKQVRDALNETRDLAVVEACAQILGV